MFIISASIAADNPFYAACSENEIDTEHLNTGFFTNKKPQVDREKGALGLHIIEALIKSAKQRVTQSNTLIQNIEFCIDNTTDENCNELNHWVYNEVPKYVKEARLHASLAQSTNNLNSWMGNPEESVNTDLSIWSVYKASDWDKQTPDEFNTSIQRLSKYKNQIHKKSDELIKKGKLKSQDKEDFYDRTLLDARYRHFLKYQMILGNVHMLQYITSANPTILDIKSALGQLKENLIKEANYLRSLESHFEIRFNTTMELTNRMLEMFNYTTLLEGFLMERPKYCNLAAALMKYRDARSIKITAGVALPVMAASFFVPPVAGLAAGVFAGAGFAAHSQYNLEQEKMKNFGHVYGDENGIEGHKVSETKRMRDFDVVIMPIGLGLFGSASSKGSQMMIKTSSKVANRLTFKSLKLENLSSINNVKNKFSKIKLWNLNKL